MVEDEEDFWVPPPLDDEMQIPGKLVMARDKALKIVSYWPGRLLAYIPPPTREQESKYTVMVRQGIPRSCFYTMKDDGFTVCRVSTTRCITFIKVLILAREPNKRGVRSTKATTTTVTCRGGIQAPLHFPHLLRWKTFSSSQLGNSLSMPSPS